MSTLPIPYFGADGKGGESWSQRQRRGAGDDPSDGPLPQAHHQCRPDGPGSNQGSHTLYPSFRRRNREGCGGVRVGLEDNLYFDFEKTKLATNEQLVQRVVQIARLIGRETATPRTPGRPFASRLNNYIPSARRPTFQEEADSRTSLCLSAPWPKSQGAERFLNWEAHLAFCFSSSLL